MNRIKKVMDGLEVGDGMALTLLAIMVVLAEDVSNEEFAKRFGTRGLEAREQYLGKQLDKKVAK